MFLFHDQVETSLLVDRLFRAFFSEYELRLHFLILAVFRYDVGRESKLSLLPILLEEDVISFEETRYCDV